MKYINANVILPEKLIEEIQKYIQGKYIYIPIKKENHECYCSWLYIGIVRSFSFCIACQHEEIVRK